MTVVVTPADAAPHDATRRPVLRATLDSAQARAGAAIVAVVVVVGLAGPMLTSVDPNAYAGRPFTSTGALGTDTLGRDVLSRFLHGGRSIMALSAAAALLGVALGAGIGLVAGSSRSWRSSLLMRGVDLALALPQGVLVLLFVTRLGPRWWLLIGMVGLTHAPRVARVVRASTAEVVERDFVTSMRALGLPRRHLLASEVLPNVMGPIMVELGLSLTFSAAVIGGLNFLGFGIQPPAVDWGLMIAENRGGLNRQAMGVIAPAAGLAALTVGINLITDAVAKAVAGIEDRTRP